VDLLSRTCAAIPALDAAAMAAARARLETLTKPSGSLGRLEELAVALAGMRAQERPRLARKAIVVCAGDHGVSAAGVSAYPTEVTAQMLANFARGGAAINVLARQHGAEVRAVDVAVCGSPLAGLGLARWKVREGSEDLSKGAALTRAQALRSLEVGIELAERADVLATGDMGIGNIIASTALIAALTGEPAHALVGRGTGIGEPALARKRELIAAALALHRPDLRDPLGALACLGGCEIGALAGLILGGAARRIPVVLDGIASGAAALLARALAPRALDYCIAGHVSAEPAHRVALRALGLRPLLDLELRLGEGSGAALALPLLDSACLLLDEMATFAEAAVSERGAAPGAR
jgi:nicotinate-nucleotide--dimethylbenzimidazole phosphoribosyltransferase